MSQIAEVLARITPEALAKEITELEAQRDTIDAQIKGLRKLQKLNIQGGQITTKPREEQSELAKSIAAVIQKRGPSTFKELAQALNLHHVAIGRCVGQNPGFDRDDMGRIILSDD